MVLSVILRGWRLISHLVLVKTRRYLNGRNNSLIYYIKFRHQSHSLVRGQFLSSFVIMQSRVFIRNLVSLNINIRHQIPDFDVTEGSMKNIILQIYAKKKKESSTFGVRFCSKSGQFRYPTKWRVSFRNYTTSAKLTRICRVFACYSHPWLYPTHSFFRSLLSGSMARQNRSGDRLSPWKIPRFIFTSGTFISPPL